MALGISYNNVDKNSFLGLRRDHLLFPLAQDTDYLSAATTHGGAQAVKDISASVAGDTIHLSAQAQRPLIYGRLPKVTLVDASGSNLNVTVRIVGRRFGVQFYQDITITGPTLVGSGTRVIDEVVSMTILSIANNAASDTLSVGIDDSWLGLTCPIRSYRDVRMIMKSASGTPNSTGTRYSADLSSSLVNAQGSAIDMKTLYSAALAVTDQYIVEYEAAGAGVESFVRKGLRFN